MVNRRRSSNFVKECIVLFVTWTKIGFFVVVEEREFWWLLRFCLMESLSFVAVVCRVLFFSFALVRFFMVVCRWEGRDVGEMGPRFIVVDWWFQERFTVFRFHTMRKRLDVDFLV